MFYFTCNQSRTGKFKLSHCTAMALSENQKIEHCHICFWKAGETEVSHTVVSAHHGLTVQSRSGQMPTHLRTRGLPFSQTISMPDKLVPLAPPSLPLWYSSHPTLSHSSRTILLRPPPTPCLHPKVSQSSHLQKKSHFLVWDTLLLFLNFGNYF